MKAKWFSRFLSMIVLFVMIFGTALPANANSSTPSSLPNVASNLSIHRYILVAKNASLFSKLQSDSVNAGASVVEQMPEANILVVTSKVDIEAKLKANPAVQSVAKDQVRTLVQPQMVQEMGFDSSPDRIRIDLGRGVTSTLATPDPANSLPGLMWNMDRIKAPTAWKTTFGDPSIYVGVADTGLDYTHSELASKVVSVVNLTDPTLCPMIYAGTPNAMTDADWAAKYGGPALTDWNGHGSWIGGNIAAALDGVGVNGIAPNVNLVALKISEWCGYAWDSSILMAFYYAAIEGIDIVSISFGGYLDRSDPDQDAIYQDYVGVVKYAAKKGTVIVAAAGNEHARIGAGGKVLSHGILMLPGSTTLDDYYGMYETPGGIPGVVDVSATGNVTNAPSATCATGTFETSDATCKPTSDAHQPMAVGMLNQLTYYSNYGPRIDVAAPGGARKFNVPNADRGGTGGWPVIDVSIDGYNAWEDFSITSNWALEIPCYYDIGSQFYPNDCYSTIQGTSMATPHVSAVLALIASQNLKARHNPGKLVSILKKDAQKIKGNKTPPLSATDLSAGDLSGLLCTTGYCHLGGKAISDKEAYGAGLVDASMFK